MPSPNAIVSRHIRLEPAPERAAAGLRAAEGPSVELDEGRRAHLDPGDPRSPGFAQVLEGLASLGRPVYLEVDPESSAITRLRVPLVTRVIGLQETEAGHEVALDRSQARHLLERDEPDFTRIEGLLREALDRSAPVVVTVDDAQHVIDVRFYEPGPEDAPLPPLVEPRFPTAPVALGRLRDLPIWPWRWVGGISLGEARQIFDALAATTCDPCTVPVPCIPFRFPASGCWTRAHEMCRLMIAMGLSPRKVWLTGRLKARTSNDPNCEVGWQWHVAPTLIVRQGRLSQQAMVFDPSLFTVPVSEATWKGVQGDPDAKLTPTDASYYYFSATDPDYIQTVRDLAGFRLQLLAMTNEHGPPPYAKCA